MTTLRATIPGEVFDRALTARNAATRVSSALTGSATHESLVSARGQLKVAMDALRDLRPLIAVMERELRAQEIRERQFRDRAVMIVGVGV